MQQEGQGPKRAHCSRLQRPFRARVCVAAEPVLPEELPDSGGLVRPHLVRGHQGVVHHVDELLHRELDGRLLEPHAAFGLFYDSYGRLFGCLGHFVPTEGATLEH